MPRAKPRSFFSFSLSATNLLATRPWGRKPFPIGAGFFPPRSPRAKYSRIRAAKPASSSGLDPSPFSGWTRPPFPGPSYWALGGPERDRPDWTKKDLPGGLPVSLKPVTQTEPGALLAMVDVLKNKTNPENPNLPPWPGQERGPRPGCRFSVPANTVPGPQLGPSPANGAALVARPSAAPTSLVAHKLAIKAAQNRLALAFFFFFFVFFFFFFFPRAGSAGRSDCFLVEVATSFFQKFPRTEAFGAPSNLIFFFL